MLVDVDDSEEHIRIRRDRTEQTNHSMDGGIFRKSELRESMTINQQTRGEGVILVTLRAEQ